MPLLANTYDPWPLVEAWERLSADPKHPALLTEWQAWYSQSKAASLDWNGPPALSPREKEIAASTCLTLQPLIMSGSSTDLLEAVAICADHGIAMPGWLAQVFSHCVYGVIRGDHKDWNEAFGTVGGNVAGRRAKVVLTPRAYAFAMTLLEANPDRPIDGTLYEEIGSHIHKSASQVQEYLRAMDKDDKSPLAYVKPPLAYVKAKLRNGEQLQSIMTDWLWERFDQSR